MKKILIPTLVIAGCISICVAIRKISVYRNYRKRLK